MIDRRDWQRSRVYAWEERFVVPHDPSQVAFARAQGMVDAIWADMGLRFPPKVERLPRQARCTLADASRLSIRLADHNPSWCLLHELAHAMSSTHDERSDGRGPQFMGLYTRLLIRYLRLSADALSESLDGAGIDVDTQAKPVFLDDVLIESQPYGSTRSRAHGAIGDEMGEIAIGRLSDSRTPSPARLR